MATYNGAPFLGAQLDSIAAQSHVHWTLWVSDDGSCDTTSNILAQFALAHPQGRVHLLRGPSKGATKNFLSLVQRADLQDRALAFCDQDDVWDHDHLSRALNILADIAAPLAVYGARMRICDANLRQIGLSPRPDRPLGFRNALVQNVLSGNTMVMKAGAAELLRRAAATAGDVIVHDWWAYQLITGAGGKAYWDERPSVHYRQHDHNVIGANRGIGSIPTRLGRHLLGVHKDWALRNCAALQKMSALLTPEHRATLQAFATANTAPWPRNLAEFWRSGVYYQGNTASAAFWLTAAFGRR